MELLEKPTLKSLALFILLEIYILTFWDIHPTWSQKLRYFFSFNNDVIFGLMLSSLFIGFGLLLEYVAVALCLAVVCLF